MHALSRLLLCTLLMLAVPAKAADTYFPTPGGGGINGAVGMCLKADGNAVPCSDPLALASPNSLLTATLGGATPFHLVAAATTNATLISTGPHTVYSAQLGGIGAAPAYLKFYDKATSPTCNSDAVIKTLLIPVASTAALGSGSNVSIALGFKVTNGLAICVTNGIADNDNVAVAAGSFLINIDYK